MEQLRLPQAQELVPAMAELTIGYVNDYIDLFN
jgi:hypothetical protein